MDDGDEAGEGGEGVDALLSGPRRALQLGLSARAGTHARGVKHVLRVSARAQVRAREVPKAVANSM